jgi:hypothetical protein
MEPMRKQHSQQFPITLNPKDLHVRGVPKVTSVHPDPPSVSRMITKMGCRIASKNQLTRSHATGLSRALMPSLSYAWRR